MKANYTRLIGLCAMIFRKRTDFTTEWYGNVTALLDEKFDALVANPARHPQDHLGVSFSDGSISTYPLAWTAVGGDIFHPLAYKYYDKLLHGDIAPSFQNYR